MRMRRFGILILVAQMVLGSLAFADSPGPTKKYPNPCIRKNETLRLAWDTGGRIRKEVRLKYQNEGCEGVTDPAFLAKIRAELNRGTEAGVPPCDGNCDTPVVDTVPRLQTQVREIREALPPPPPPPVGGGFGDLFSNPMVTGIGGALLGGVLGYMIGKNSANNQPSPYWQGVTGPGFNQMPQPFFARPGFGMMGPGAINGFGSGLPSSYPAPGGFGQQPYYGGGYGNGIYSGFGGGASLGGSMFSGSPYFAQPLGGSNIYNGVGSGYGNTYGYGMTSPSYSVNPALAPAILPFPR